MPDADTNRKQLVAEVTALRQRIATLEDAEVKRKQAEEALQHTNALLHSVSQIQSEFIVDANPQVSFDRLLHTLLTLTHSEYGFIGELRYSATDDPYLKMYAITNIAWDRDSQAFYEHYAPDGLKLHNAQTLFGAVMTTGEPLIANAPATDPRRGGLPQGHPPLHAFLGLPVARGRTVIGMVGIANRPGGYDRALIEFLQPFLLTCGVIFDAYRQAQQRQQAENALRQSEHRYRHLMEHSLGLLCIHDLDGILLEINAAAARALGYQPQDGVGKSLRVFIAPEVQDQFDAYLERIRQHPTDSGLLRVVTRTGEERVWLYRNVRYEEPDRLPYVLGHAVDITERVQAEQELQQAQEALERRVAERTAALQGANTSLEAEITERQQAEAALRASEQRYRQLVDSSQGLICTHDLEGTVLSINPAAAQTLGYEPQTIVGKNLRGFLAASVQHLFDAYLERLRCHGTARGLMRVVTPTGDERVLTYHNRRIENAGEAPYILGHAQDITERVHAEEELCASEAKFRDLIEGSIQGILIHRDDHVLFVNQAYADIFGYATPDEMCCLDSVLTLAAPHERERLLRYREAQLARESVPSYYEYQGVCQDGSLVWLEIRIRLVTWQGTPAFQSTVADITERKEAESALRQSEERFRQLVEGSIQGIMIHRAGTPVFANQAYAAIYGYDAPEDILRVANIFQDVIAPEDRARLEYYFQARLRGESVPTHYTCRGVRRDGSSIWVDNIVTVVTWWGETAIQCTVVDISERKRTEAALRESEERYRTLVDQAADGILIADAQGTYVDINRSGCAMLGYNREEVIGMGVGDLIPPEDLEVEPLKMATLSAGVPVVTERRFTRKDGTLLPVEISAKILSDGRLQSIVRDITERRHLEDQLRHVQKMEAIGTLAGGIAHEFNNMLAAILGYTQLATAEVPATSPVSQYLQAVETAGNRAKDLVRQILVFSHPSDLKREPVQLALVIQESLKLLRASLPTTIKIRQQIAPDTGTVLADATQLQQVLMNLCTNAEYAMRETGGILEVSADNIEVNDSVAAFHPDLQPGLKVRVRVRDTGAGIPTDVMRHIFEPFFTTKGIGEGTGMGLAIVHGIVTNHGGVMTVESTPGQGTTFAFYLPQIAHDKATTADPPEPITPQGTGRILFVDDEEVLTRLGQALLERLGYEVEAYTSSLDALAAFRAAPDQFDVVITDQTMPAMTGATLVAELRYIRRDVPIILCTGFSHLMNAEKAQALGVDAFVMKPGVTQELAVTIRQVLEKRVLSLNSVHGFQTISNRLRPSP